MRLADNNTVSSQKQAARSLFEQTLAAVDVREAVRRHLGIDRLDLYVGGARFAVRGLRKIVLVAMGKAATPMYEAAAAFLRSAPGLATPVEAIVVSLAPPLHPPRDLTYFNGEHPIPGETSRLAAAMILDRLRRVDAETLVIFLLSGGASAMVEAPLDPAITVADQAEYNRLLVGSGLSITEINILRKHVSAVKGGRLAEAAAPAAQATLIVSDVPGDALDTVGSGPTMPDTSRPKDRLRIYRKLRSTGPLPPSVEGLFAVELPFDTLTSGHSAFARASWTCILSSGDLASCAAQLAAAQGFHVEIDNGCDDWPAEDAARYLLRRSAELRQHHGRCCLLSVGEVSVALPDKSGRGGRNQHLCLQSALHLAGSGETTTVLSAGSDGVDGNSSAAGAIIDGNTALRARRLGFDPEASLAGFDSFTLLDALGDTLITGPTGNNLRDLRILLA